MVFNGGAGGGLMRLRILVGTVALVLGLVIYALLAMAIATRLPQSAAIAFGFYARRGRRVGRRLPSLLTRWMLRAAPYRPPRLPEPRRVRLNPGFAGPPRQQGLTT